MQHTLDKIARAAAKFKKASFFEEENLFLGDLLWDKSKLIDDAASALWKQVTGSLGVFCIDRVWLERIISQKVVDGHLDEGQITWTLHLGIPGNQVTKSISIPYAVHGGKIEGAKYFIIPSGSYLPLTKADLQNYLSVGKRPGW